MEIVALLVGVVLIAACGAFVAAEFALITVNRNDVEAAAAAGDKRSMGVLRGMKTMSTQLSGAQLGITVTNLGIGFLAEPAISTIIDGPLETVGLSPAAATTVSVTIALVLATSLTMIFGELIPKNLAIARPLQTARAVQGFQRGFTKSTAYPIRFFNGTANRVVRLLGFEPQEELASARSPEELLGLVRHSANKGALAVDTAELVERSFAFGDRRANDVMTPRGQILSLDPQNSVHELLIRAKATGHSRFPIIGGDGEGTVLGLAHVRHALAVPYLDRDRVTVESVMGKVTTVPDTVELDSLMDTLREGGLQMAVLIDEFGDTAGLVTLEDLVEELWAKCATSTSRCRRFCSATPTAPGTSRRPCGPTKPANTSTCSFPSTRSTTPSPGWSPSNWAASHGSATASRSPANRCRACRSPVSNSRSRPWTITASTGCEFSCTPMSTMRRMPMPTRF